MRDFMTSHSAKRVPQNIADLVTKLVVAAETPLGEGSDFRMDVDQARDDLLNAIDELARQKQDTRDKELRALREVRDYVLENNNLRLLLNKAMDYVFHKDYCDRYPHPSAGRPCDCGYRELMKEYKELIG